MINTNDSPWVEIQDGVMEKNSEQNGVLIRLLKFNSTYKSIEWCDKGHLVYVIKGELELEYASTKLQYKQGDPFVIAPDELHRISVLGDKNLELVVFEYHLNQPR